MSDCGGVDLDGFMMIENNACLAPATGFVVLVWAGEEGISLRARVVSVTCRGVRMEEKGVEEHGQHGGAGKGEETHASRRRQCGECSGRGEG